MLAELMAGLEDATGEEEVTMEEEQDEVGGNGKRSSIERNGKEERLAGEPSSGTEEDIQKEEPSVSRGA